MMEEGGHTCAPHKYTLLYIQIEEKTIEAATLESERVQISKITQRFTKSRCLHFLCLCLPWWRCRRLNSFIFLCLFPLWCIFLNSKLPNSLLGILWGKIGLSWEFKVDEDGWLSQLPAKLRLWEIGPCCIRSSFVMGIHSTLLSVLSLPQLLLELLEVRPLWLCGELRWLFSISLEIGLKLPLLNSFGGVCFRNFWRGDDYMWRKEQFNQLSKWNNCSLSLMLTENFVSREAGLAAPEEI